MFKFIITVTVMCGLAGSFNAKATTIDFSTALLLGNLPQAVSVGGITASAWVVSKTSGTGWSLDGVILNNRNEGSSELGLGVCFKGSCPATGNGDINEIDNNGTDHFDVVRLDFGSATFVNSIGLSSLDSGLKDGFAIFGNNSALPDFTLLTPLAKGTNQSVGSVEPIIPVRSVISL